MTATRTAILTLLATAACAPEGSDGADAFVALLPSAEDVRLDAPPAASSARTEGELDEFYLMTRQVSGDVNGLVEGWLEILQDIVALPHTTDEDGNWVWGPFHQGEGGLAPTTEYLTARRTEDGSYAYVLTEAPRSDEDDPDAYVPIVAGAILGGTSIEDSYGVIAVDFDAALEMDPTRTSRGRAIFAYDFSGASTAEWGGGPIVVAALKEVAEGDEDPVDAVYGYVRTPAGAGVMDLYVDGDLTGSGVDEQWAVRSRWTPSGPGRSDMAATGGDLGDEVVVINDCWGEDYTTVYRADDHGWTGVVGSEEECAFAEESLPGGLPDWIEEEIAD